MARVSVWDEKRDGRAVPAPTLPQFDIVDISDDAIEEEARAAQARIIERRIIRAARDCWAASNKAGSWEAIQAIGAGLLIGRNYALRVTGLDAPHGRRYSIALRQWMRTNGLGTMPNTTRKHIVILTENAAAVTVFRNALPERERNRIANPQHLYRRWQASLKNGHGKCLAYVKRDAITAYRKFVSCVKLLPANDARRLLQAAFSELAAISASK